MTHDMSSATGRVEESRRSSDPAADLTGGSPQRAARDLAGALRSLSVSEVMGRLRDEPAFGTDGRNSETILHDGSARVVLTAIDAGRDIGSDVSDGHIALVLLEGAGTLTQGEASSSLGPGGLAILAPDAAWSFRADEACAIVSCFWQPAT